MSTPMRPWDMNPLQNSTQLQSTSNLRLNNGAPAVPPLRQTAPAGYSNYNSYMPYSSGMGYSSPGFGSYGGYGMPYRSSLGSSYGSYGSYGGYNNYGMYGMGGYPGYNDETERRFVQFAEERSRDTFASMESLVRSVSSVSMMLDNTFFAMTSSFRAVLSVAENFGKLRSMFGHIWYTINIFRLFKWLLRKFWRILGYKVPDSASIAWSQAKGAPGAAPSGSSWSTLAFLGALLSAPYILSKFLPKYEDKGDPANWKSPGVRAMAAFDFAARSTNELNIATNEEITLAPTYIQEEMQLKNSGWAFGVCNNKSGIVPLNYLLINKAGESKSQSSFPVPRVVQPTHKSHTHKRVSFGENQIFENVDLEDYMTGKKEMKVANEHSKSTNVQVPPESEDSKVENSEEVATINPEQSGDSEEK